MQTGILGNIKVNFCAKLTRLSNVILNEYIRYFYGFLNTLINWINPEKQRKLYRYFHKLYFHTFISGHTANILYEQPCWKRLEVVSFEKPITWGKFYFLWRKSFVSCLKNSWPLWRRVQINLLEFVPDETKFTIYNFSIWCWLVGVKYIWSHYFITYSNSRGWYSYRVYGPYMLSYSTRVC